MVRTRRQPGLLDTLRDLWRNFTKPTGRTFSALSRAWARSNPRRRQARAPRPNPAAVSRASVAVLFVLAQILHDREGQAVVEFVNALAQA
jgi:hypothetical protein